jgi:hypothetical protein
MSTVKTPPIPSTPRFTAFASLMIQFLLRCVFFLLGLATLIDSVLPIKEELLTVEQHRTFDEGGRNPSTSYTLRMSGGRVDSCDVGYTAYNSLKDGDKVGVRATKIFRHCVQITHEGKNIDYWRFWRLMGVVAGLVSMLIAVGWLPSDEEGNLLIFGQRSN